MCMNLELQYECREFSGANSNGCVKILEQGGGFEGCLTMCCVNKGSPRNVPLL